MYIELIKQDEGKSDYWTVKYDDRYAEDLSYEEMLLVILSLTFSGTSDIGLRPGLQWMLTEDQHKAKNK